MTMCDYCGGSGMLRPVYSWGTWATTGGYCLTEHACLDCRINMRGLDEMVDQPSRKRTRYARARMVRLFGED